MSELFRCSLKFPLGLEENGHDFYFVVIFPRRAENAAGLLPLTTDFTTRLPLWMRYLTAFQAFK